MPTYLRFDSHIDKTRILQHLSKKIAKDKEWTKLNMKNLF